MGDTTHACGELVAAIAARSIGLDVGNGGRGGCSVWVVGFGLRVATQVRGTPVG
jgi:hypothetical protein